MKILIFTEGTLLIPAAGKGFSREEMVKQNLAGEVYFADFGNYVPAGKALEKVTKWHNQGTEIHYLTSRTQATEVEAIRKVLTRFHFPTPENLHYRQDNQSYANVAEQIKPDILIEDDCESIGGEVEMTFPHINEEIKPKIKSIVVKEFAGIDDLPNTLEELKTYV